MSFCNVSQQAQPQQAALTVSFVESRAASVLAALASTYTNTTGINCAIDRISLDSLNARFASQALGLWQVLGSDVPLTPQEPGGTDAWVITESQLGVASRLNAFEDLTSLLPADKAVAWNQLPQTARSVAAVYDGKVSAIPVLFDPFMLYYR